MSIYTPNIVSIIVLLALPQVLLYFTLPVTSQPSLFAAVCQDTFGNYTLNSTFKQNLNTLLSTITSDTKIDYGFYNFSVGKNLDIVNGIGLCSMGISVADCRQCLNNAAAALVEECPRQKDGIGWYEQCMIRYSNRYIFKKLEFGPWFHGQSDSHCSDKKSFNQTVAILLAKLQKDAASGDSRTKFAAGKANVNGHCIIHALVQCTPDLEYSDCYNCLDRAINFLLVTYPGQNARVSYTSCNIRFENYIFYNETFLNSLKPSRSLPPAVASSPPSSICAD